MHAIAQITDISSLSYKVPYWILLWFLFQAAKKRLVIKMLKENLKLFLCILAFSLRLKKKMICFLLHFQSSICPLLCSQALKANYYPPPPAPLQSRGSSQNRNWRSSPAASGESLSIAFLTILLRYLSKHPAPPAISYFSSVFSSRSCFKPNPLPTSFLHYAFSCHSVL